MWAGDQMVNYADQDRMAQRRLRMLSGGLSGSPLWHSDIGGYTSINAVVKNYVRPPELNQRWAQMQAFGVMSRSTHEGNRPAQNQQGVRHLRPGPRSRASKIYAAFLPVPQDGDRRRQAGVSQSDAPDLDGVPRHGR